MLIASARLRVCCVRCDRNLNNFQIQSQDYLYVDSKSGLYFDTNGIQIIIDLQLENYEAVFAAILHAHQAARLAGVSV